MSAPTPDIARLDVPLPQLVAALRTPYTPSPEELARQAAAAEHLAQVAAEAGLTPEEYAKAGGKADQQYDVHHLDVDSVDVLPDCQFISYLPGPAGGQS